MPDWLPSKDADLLAFAQSASTKITSTPVLYGLLAADATALAALVTSMAGAMTLVSNPATQTPVNTTLKDTAKAALVGELRSLARRVQAAPAVTAAQKVELGLPVKDGVPSTQPAPATKPIAAILSTGSLSHAIQIVDESTPSRKARPPIAAGAEVYSYVLPAPGDTPPTDLEMWRYEGLATKSSFTVDYNGADAGKTAVIRARWINRKGVAGPVSNPITGMVAA